MKRFSMILASALLALVGCEKSETPEPSNEELTFKLNITRTDFDGIDTRATKSDWEKGDYIYLTGGNGYSTKNVQLVYNGEEWKYKEYGTANSFNMTLSDLRSYTSLNAVYGPDNSINENGYVWKANRGLLLRDEDVPFTITGNVLYADINLRWIKNANKSHQSMFSITGMGTANKSSWYLRTTEDVGLSRISKVYLNGKVASALSGSVDNYYTTTISGVPRTVDDGVEIEFVAHHNDIENQDITFILSNSSANKSFKKTFSNRTITKSTYITLKGPGTDLDNPANGWELY